MGRIIREISGKNQKFPKFSHDFSQCNNKHTLSHSSLKVTIYVRKDILRDWPKLGYKNLIVQEVELEKSIILLKKCNGKQFLC